MPAVEGGRMAEFWDRRAREDPFHYVDNRQRLGAADEAAFWAAGGEVVDTLLGELELELTGEEAVLEIGCGIGRLTRALASRARRVCALDVSAEMLARARELNPALSNVEWLQGDGTTLAPLPDGAFDACLSFVVFQHIPDPNVTLGYVREMGRVLRPGGWSAFQVSGDPGVHRRPRLPLRVARSLGSVLARGPRGQHAAEWLGSAVSPEALRAAAEAASLDVERVLNPGSQFCLVRLRRR